LCIAIHFQTVFRYG